MLNHVKTTPLDPPASSQLQKHSFLPLHTYIYSSLINSISQTEEMTGTHLQILYGLTGKLYIFSMLFPVIFRSTIAPLTPQLLSSLLGWHPVSLNVFG